MAEKEGELLEKWAKKSGYKAQKIADLLGLSARTSVYYVYKQDVLSQEYKKILKGEGFDVDIVRKEYETSKNINSDLYQIEIDYLKEKVEMLRQENEFLKSLVNPNIKVKQNH